MTKNNIFITCLMSLVSTMDVCAATGEMGTGIPNFGIYTPALGSAARVWSLSEATINFPVGCSHIVLSSQTMGVDYKYVMAVMLTAKTTGKRVRLYAHAERDGGCGVDYVELQD